MNEYGVAIGQMSVAWAETSNDPHKVIIPSVAAIRLVLDHARDVAEAISLLRAVNITFAYQLPAHYLISDSSGDSAVVEFIDGETKVTRNSEPWLAATNFVMWGMTPESAKSSCWRYRTAYEALERAGGSISQQQAMTLLQDVSQGRTTWSAVYNMITGDIGIAMGRPYDNMHRFKLEMKRR